MATLNYYHVEKIKKSIDGCQSPWMLASFVEDPNSNAKSMQGTLGVLDWRLNGQISTLLKRGLLRKRELTLIPSQHRLGKASLLLYGDDENVADYLHLVNALKKLKTKSVKIVESTFLEKSLKRIKKTLAQSNIKWSALE